MSPVDYIILAIVAAIVTAAVVLYKQRGGNKCTSCTYRESCLPKDASRCPHPDNAPGEPVDPEQIGLDSHADVQAQGPKELGASGENPPPDNAQ